VFNDGFAAFWIALAPARNDDDDTLPKPDGRGVKSVVKVLLQLCRSSTSLHRPTPLLNPWNSNLLSVGRSDQEGNVGLGNQSVWQWDQWGPTQGLRDSVTLFEDGRKEREKIRADRECRVES
jgi:hypothetical protein